MDCEVRGAEEGAGGGGRLGLEEISNRLACVGPLGRWGTSAMPMNGLDWAGNKFLVGLRVPFF